MGLRPKQRKFVEEYLIDLNASQAAIRAGYSHRTAAIIGFENLRKPKIIAALQLRRAELAQQIKVTPESVVAEIAKIAFADMETYVQWGPKGVTLKDSEELPEGASEVVLEVSETTTKDGGTVRFKLHDKKGALDSLAKHLGILVEKHEVTGKDGGPIQTDMKVILDALADPKTRDALDALSRRLESQPSGDGG